MKLLTLDPQTAVALDWVRTLVADWVASPGRIADPVRAAVTLALRAAEFFRTDFPYLGSQVQASGLSAAGVFTSDELSDIDTNALSLLPRLATLVSP